jgi:hypothetical protein
LEAYLGKAPAVTDPHECAITLIQKIKKNRKEDENWELELECLACPFADFSCSLKEDCRYARQKMRPCFYPVLADTLPTTWYAFYLNGKELC